MLSKKKRNIKTIGDFTYSQGDHTHVFGFVTFKIMPPTMQDVENGTVSIYHRFGIIASDLKDGETIEDLEARMKEKVLAQAKTQDIEITDFVEVLNAAHADYELEEMVSKLPSFK